VSDGVTLHNQRSEIMKELNIAKTNHRERGKLLAEAERIYRIAKARKILELRAEKIAVTIILDLVKGDDEVSLLKFKRDCAEVEYKSLLEAVNILKLQLRVVEGDMENERRGM